QKIKVIKEVAPTLIVIARTDAVTVVGIESAIARANQYLTAGADAIFPEAIESTKDFLKIKQMVNAPLLANMTEFGK
ncbi:isocitrate lyase/phosphoenolpyruvate mutase family protein, partial [Alkalihalophilus lindianensis]